MAVERERVAVTSSHTESDNADSDHARNSRVRAFRGDGSRRPSLRPARDLVHVATSLDRRRSHVDVDAADSGVRAFGWDWSRLAAHRPATGCVHSHARLDCGRYVRTPTQRLLEGTRRSASRWSLQAAGNCLCRDHPCLCLPFVEEAIRFDWSRTDSTTCAALMTSAPARVGTVPCRHVPANLTTTHLV